MFLLFADFVEVTMTWKRTAEKKFSVATSKDVYFSLDVYEIEK